MRRYCGWCLGWMVVASSVALAGPQGRIVQDTWDAAYLDGSKAGFVHTRVREIKRHSQKILQTTLELHLAVKRFKQTVLLRMETGTEETEDGKVTGVSMRQYLGKEQQLVMTGTIEGDRVHVQVSGRYKVDKRNPWNDKVVGLYGQERMFKKRNVKPGDRFSYQSFQPELTAVFTSRVTVKDYEHVKSLTTKTRQRWLRVEEVADKIAGFQPPLLTLWLDRDLTPVRSQFEMQGLGQLVLERTTRAVATEQSGAGKMADIGYRQLIRLNRRLPHDDATEHAVYRITVKGEKDAATAFAKDKRQTIDKVKGDTFELHVRSIRQPESIDKPGKVSPEFLKSNYFINGDDARVRALSRQAVGEETAPWEKALLIEKWVYRHMNRMRHEDYTEALATADHVARTLEGDCTEYAMLTAAMCRAAGIPARTAVGLVYVVMAKGPVRGPVMAFHMWTEVWVAGQWMPIDATRGRGFVGATHLKIADQSWHDIHDLRPLLPVLRVVGKTKIEVISAE